MKKIKVCILAHYSPKSKRSGSVISIEDTIDNLSYRDDVELHVVTIADKNTQFETRENINVHILSKDIKPKIHTVLLISELRRKIKEIDPDIVHAIITTMPYSTAIVSIKDKPTVLSILGLSIKEMKYSESVASYIVKFFYAIHERYVISKIPNLILVTPSIKKLVRKWTESKIYVLQDCINYKRIQEFARHKSEKPDVLFISHLTKLKGVDVLLKAIPIVIQSVPNLSVYIAGDGPQRDNLEKLAAELKIENHVKFLGFISKEEDKYSYYKACKVIVAPSRWDCQPFAVTEGAACGKPTIASDHSNPALLLDGKIGLTFRSEDHNDLANAIIKLLKDDKLQAEMGTAGKERIKEHDCSKMAEKQVEIYREIIFNFNKQKGIDK